MIYGSVCSGIEAASVAWEPLGWEPAFFSEIEAFPRAVLKHRFPGVPLHGDFTTIKAGEYRPIRLLVGGTPCQSFSVAGLRGGIADKRGNLALQFLLLAQRLRPRWLVWENVPGVLSSGGGRDFGSILGGMVELGYGFAYRVLDARYTGVPQRRRRIFVVGCLGGTVPGWRSACEVLFEPYCLSWHPAPRKEAREGVAGCLGGGSSNRGWSPDTDRMTFLPVTPPLTSNPYGDHESREGLLVPELARCQTTGEERRQDGESCNFVAQVSGTLPASGAGTDRTGNAYNEADMYIAESYAIRGTLCGRSADKGGPGGSGVLTGVQCPLNASEQHAVAFQYKNSAARNMNPQDFSPSLETTKTPAVTQGMRVRRLTPVECERLQGFSDGWTQVPYRGKEAQDGPRYKALGNSMAVPVMRWIGQRIERCERLMENL